MQPEPGGSVATVEFARGGKFRSKVVGVDVDEGESQRDSVGIGKDRAHALAVYRRGRHPLWVRRLLVLLAVFIALGSGHSTVAAAAKDPMLTLRASFEPSPLGVGERGLLRVAVQIPSGWHLWSMDPGPGPLPLKLSLQSGAGLELVGDWYGEAPGQRFIRGFARDLKLYDQAEVQFERTVQVHSTAPSVLHLDGQICTDLQCLPQRLDVTVTGQLLESAQGKPAPAPRFGALTIGSLTPASLMPASSMPEMPAAAAPQALPGGSVQADLASAKERGVLSFMALAFVFGLGALATPCVFPAIPLTISFFSKYAHESFGRSARLAFVYATTMVVAFTLLGVLLSVVFGVTGVQRFASHPLFNLTLAGVLIFFALNLLGLFEISAPSFLLDASNRLESKFGAAAQGTGERKSGGLGDYVAVAIAAVTSTTVFFTCTVAFVGLVLVAAANGEWFWPTVGMLAFASAFALPFFLLALFPRAANRLRGRAGGWLTATRVTLGFFELAAATKFLSNADLVWSWGIVSRQLVLAFWVPLFFLCGLFLLGKLRLGEDSGEAGRTVTGVPQMLASMVMFALSLHLGVGLIKDRPFGGWLDGWLPPLPVSAANAEGGAAAGLSWLSSLAEGRAVAAREGKLVFVNYTGYTCTNCRYMEGGVFTDPRIDPLLRQLVRVELYTDGGKAEHDANRDDQVQRFATAALPLYSVEDASGKSYGVFPSSTNDIEQFRRFLAESLAAGKAALGAAPLAAPSTILAAMSSEQPSPRLQFKATRLDQGQPGIAVVDGKWSLVNLWATWCAPCREELEGFLVQQGAELVTRGGAFRVVAVESEEKLDEARRYMRELGVPAEAALRLPSEDAADAIDAALGWDESLPFTFLVSPTGKAVWRHTGALKPEQLQRALNEFAFR
jgi:thiol:disulfide interchange protein